MVCNSRFLIVPSIRVKHLASHLLSKSVGQVGDDWEQLYGYRPVLAETFVDGERFRGTSYRAANWVYVGQTAGRGRQDPENRRDAGVKDIYVYALREDWRKELIGDAGARMPARRREASDWAEEEFGEAELGDERLRKRLCEVARDFYSHPQANVPEACCNQAKTKAVYRFFANEKTTMEGILRPHYEQTQRRIAGEKIVLAVQDTTSLNYTAHALTQGLGPINTAKDQAIGLLVHDTMAFSEEGVPLGLLDVQCWARDEKEQGKSQKRYDLPIEEKESLKWLTSYRAVEQAQRRCPETQIILVSDRESDLHELFVEARESKSGPALLVRADRGRQRKVETEYLWDMMSRQAVAGIYEVLIPAREDRPSRVAQLEVRHTEVTLNAPKRKKQLGGVTLYAVYGKEAGEVEEDGLEWMLLTSLRVESFAEAEWILRCYAKRWGIEVYHRTLKSGCKVEDRQLGNADRIQTCLAIDMVVAWRIYHLTLLGRRDPQAPCTVFFDDTEWKALVAYVTKNPTPPKQPPSLAEAIQMLASLGGHLGRKSDGNPGTTYIWRGIQKLDVVTQMYKVFCPTYHENKVNQVDPVSRSP